MLVSDEYKLAVYDLRHSVALHLRIAGDATVDIAAITVNLLDIMIDDEQSAIIKMNDLSKWLVKRLCDLVIKQARLNNCDIRHVENKYKPDANKNEFLALIANCLRAMDKKPIEIYDVNGVLL